MKKYSGIVGGILLALVLVIGVICVFTCVERIPAGYVGVVYNMNGGIEDKTLTQGWKIVAPTKKVTLYSIGMEQSYLTSEEKGDSQEDDSFTIPTSDGKTVKVDLEFSYRFDEERVAETFVMFKGKNGETIKDIFIKPKIVAWTQEVSANYPVTDIFGDKRTQINAELDVYLKEKFDKYGIIIDTVNFTNISVDSETAAAIQKKVNAQQELELAQVQAQTAKVEADKNKEVALIKAEQDKEAALIQAEQQKEVAQKAAERAIIEAEGRAEAMRIEAEAEAKANQVISASLTDALLEQAKIEQWNGSYPSTVVNGSSTPVITLP